MTEKMININVYTSPDLPNELSLLKDEIELYNEKVAHQDVQTLTEEEGLRMEEMFMNSLRAMKNVDVKSLTAHNLHKVRQAHFLGMNAYMLMNFPVNYMLKELFYEASKNLFPEFELVGQLIKSQNFEKMD